MRLGLGSAVLLLGFGCFDPTLPPVMCGPADQCPTGLSCNTATNVCGDSSAQQADASSIDASSSGADGAQPDASGAMLIDRGLVVRYFLDEADTGTGPLMVADSAANPLDLPVNYDADMEWGELSGSRGLVWTDAGGDGYAGMIAGGTKIQTDLNGSRTGTIEVVAAVTEVVAADSRLFFLGKDTNNEGVALETDDPATIRIEAGNFEIEEYPVPNLGTGVVIHAVIDSTRVLPGNRAQLYVDGVEVAPSSVLSSIVLGDSLVVDDGIEMALGNRLVGGRSFAGHLGYAALYSTALTPDEVAQNAAILAAGNDSL